MKKPSGVSAGILLFRRHRGELDVLLAHPGGPFWAKKDAGAWSIPKGLIEPTEDHLAAAVREFEEEIGFRPDGPFISLDSVRQKAGKVIHAWACEGDVDPASTKSNLVSIEWPPGSGRQFEFPEVDKCQWFGLAEARAKLNPAQVDFIERLEKAVALTPQPPLPRGVGE
jgi:predicted NUDIX family NTP pyrophosphohydrolase